MKKTKRINVTVECRDCGEIVDESKWLDKEPKIGSHYFSCGSDSCGDEEKFVLDYVWAGTYEGKESIRDMFPLSLSVQEEVNIVESGDVIIGRDPQNG